MKNRKLVLLEDLDGNEFTIAPSAIINVVDSGNGSIVETKYGNVATKSNRKSIENSIHNCKLP